MMKRIFMMVLANVLMIMISPAQTNNIQNPILPGAIPTCQWEKKESIKLQKVAIQLFVIQRHRYAQLPPTL